MKDKLADAKMRIIPIFLIIGIVLALTISSEVDKRIDIGLDYSNSTNYDINNDGIESTNGIVDLTVEKTFLTWDADKSKLLTRWTIENIDDKTSTVLCYGSSDGCGFIGLLSASKNWDDTFYVNYGKDGAGYNNKVSAQIIYYDVNLSVPYSDIFYSSEAEKEVKFYEKDPSTLSNLNVAIKDKIGISIGHYEVSESDSGFDLIISNKKQERKRLVSLSSKESISESPESRVIIKNLKNIQDIVALIDKTQDNNIKTDVVAVDESNLIFENAEITLAKTGNVNKILRCANFDFENFKCDDWQETNIQFVDEGKVIKFNVTGFSAYAGAEINIINVHSYPPLYGNWTVMFNTTGTANLTIKAFNGTSWTDSEDVGSGYDLKFLEIRCGDVILPYEWKDNTAFIEDYTCNETGYETQKELTTGKHYLEFSFGDKTAYAYNAVGAISLSSSVVEKGNTVTATSSGDCATWAVAGGTGNCSLSPNACSATILALRVGTCIIQVANATGGDIHNATITIQDTTPPAADYFVNASDYLRDQWENGIQIGWNRSSSNDVVNYTLKRSIGQPSGGGIVVTITGSDITSGSWNYLDLTTNNDTDTTYYYGVTACDDQGNCNSGVWSEAAHINALPIMNITRITHIDNTNASIREGNARSPVANDSLRCVGIAYDKDNESVSMVYNITIMETYNRGSSQYLSGVLTNCIYVDSDSTDPVQNIYRLTRGHTLCEVNINMTSLSKGDKITCSMTPYDSKEYGDKKTSEMVYINNTRPYASQVYITPTSPNESSTLTCNYTFNDPDCAGGICDTENTSAALFKWYINNEGLNDFIEIPGQTGRTLSSYFDKDDIVMCSVKVKDIDTGWLFNPLSDDEYVNSSSKVIRDNAKPQIIDYSDNSNETDPTTEGQSVIFNATWADYEDANEIAQIYVCGNNLDSEIPDETGKGNLTIGKGNSTILYTNLTGQYVETIAIKPNAFINSSGDLSLLNASTDYVYDVYAFEVDNVGDKIPTFDITNMSTYPIAEDHNNAFTNGRWNYIKLQYNSQPLVGKRLAIVFCIDSNDDNHIYCGSDISSSGQEAIFIRASPTPISYNINITNGSGIGVASYSNASISINYRSVSGGDTSSTGCVGTEYCHTEFSSASQVSCDYTVKPTDPQQSNTYYIKACDDGGQCSVWRQGSFWVNYKAQMNVFNLTVSSLGGTNFTDDSNLNCSQNNGTDDWIKDSGSLTFTYKWYLDRNTSVFSLFSTSPDAQILSHANTLEGDRWICEVTPNDGFSNGFPRNSSNIAYIGINPINNYNANGTPYILNAAANSDHTNPTSESSTVTVSVNWSDSNSTSINKIYICNSSSVTTTGCLGYQFASYDSTSSKLVNVGFTAQPSWSENQTMHIFVYDDTWLISPEYNTTFVVNHRPNATNVQVDYITASSLTCAYIFNNSKDSSDVENTTLTVFKWWMDGQEQVGLTAKNITGVSIPTHTWVCGVKVYDNHGLSSSNYLNSSIFYGTNSIITPIVWALPEAVASDNKTENNASTINIIGYINRSNVNITAIAKQNDDIKINSMSNGSANATLLGTGYSYTNYAKGGSYIRVSESYATIFTAGRFIEFANHNKTYFTRYNITSQTYLYDGTYRININTNLESAVSPTEMISVYDLEKPSGWFNLTLSLFNGSNEVKIRGYENVSSTWLTGMFTTFTVYYDNQSPIINTSIVPTASNENSRNISFSLTDDFKVNLSTLLINISNATFNVTHRYDSLVYNQTFNWGTNISCSGNNTNKDCTVLLNLNNGNYTITFSVNDSVGNKYTTQVYSYLVDSTRPSAPTVYAKSIQNITNLSVLWRDSSSNITNIQYAVGESRTGTGWNSTRGWTNASENISNKLLDENNDYYPDDYEALIASTDYNLSSNDIVVRNGSAALKRFTNGTEMINGSTGIFNITNAIIRDLDGDSLYNNVTDLIVYGSAIPNGSQLYNFSNTTLVYSDADNDNYYDIGEAILSDKNANQKLDIGNLSISGNDEVIVNATVSQLYIPLTTSSLILENHHFYYVSVQYKADQNLFYSLTGTSLSIKYKTSSGGGGNNETNCTGGPAAVGISAALISEMRILNATWNNSLDNCYAITNYSYTLGTAKYPNQGYDSIKSWTNNGLNKTAFVNGALADGKTYYWNVKAINSISQESTITSSDGTTYYDQIAPVIESWDIKNGTNSSGIWLDSIDDNSTIIRLYGDENMSCFISLYDKGYTNYNSSRDTICNFIQPYPGSNLSCNLTNLSQGTYNYHIVCQDTTIIPNKQTAENNKDIAFTINYNDAPILLGFTIWAYHPNMTLRGEARNISNTTFTDDFLVCNGTYYDQDENNLLSGYLTWKNNDQIISTSAIINQSYIYSSLNLSINGSKGDNISCAYNLTDDSMTPTNNTAANYTVHINNSLPILSSSSVIINSSNLLNKTNESLGCYAPPASDIDNDFINYSYLWYRNGTLNLTISNKNIGYNLLSSGNTTRGDTWSCSVMPYDGSQNGTSKSSSNLTILNSAPYSIGTTTITLKKNLPNSDLNISLYFVDLDNDALTYNYTKPVNTNVSLNQITGIVTFTPDNSFVGLNYIQFNATDSSSETSSYSQQFTINVTNSTIDVALSSPINNYNTSGASIDFLCYANNSINNNLTNATLKIYNSSGTIFNNTINSTIPASNMSNSLFSISGLIEGNYTWNCYFGDSQNNQGSASNAYSFRIDASAPRIAFSTGTETNNSFVIHRWIYSDVTLSESVKNITWNINGTNITTFNETRYGYNVTSLTNGTYLYNVTACDFVGNCNSTETRTITINTSLSPTISNVKNYSITSSGVTINWSTDIEANSTVYYGTNNTNLTLAYGNNVYSKNHELILTGLTSSTQYFYVVSSTTEFGMSSNSSQIYNFTTSAATSSPSGSSGSGGGGGSSSSGTTNRISLGTSFSGYNIKRNDILEFAFKNTTYSLKVVQVASNYVEFLVTQTSYRFAMNLGDTRKVDLNGDGKDDIELKLVSINSQKVANLLIRSVGEPKALYIIPQTTKPIKPTTTELQPVQPEQPTIIQTIQKTGKDNIIPYAIAALMAIAIVGSLVMKEKVRINYIYSRPELRLHDFIKKAKSKGHRIEDVKKALVENGWPAHTVDAVSLHETIEGLVQKGNNHKIVRDHLSKKGFNQKVINDAIMHHYISNEIGNRKSIKMIRQELLDAGWDQKLVDKKLPSK